MDESLKQRFLTHTFTKDDEIYIIQSKPTELSDLYYIKKSYVLSKCNKYDIPETYQELTQDDCSHLMFYHHDPLFFIKNYKEININKKNAKHSILSSTILRREQFHKDYINVEFLEVLNNLGFDFDYKLGMRDESSCFSYIFKLSDYKLVNYLIDIGQTIDISDYSSLIFEYNDSGMDEKNIEFFTKISDKINDHRFLLLASYTLQLDAKSESFKKNGNIYEVTSDFVNFCETHNIPFLEKNRLSNNL